MGLLQPGFTVTVNTIGDWDKAMLRLMALDATVRLAGLAGQKKVAKTLEKIVKDHLKNQDLSWTPLSPETKKKYSLGADLILVDSTTYYNAITTWKENDTYYCGVPTGISEPNGNNTAEIASLLETGSPGQKIPSRPLWQPSIWQMGGPKGMRDGVAIGIRDALRKIGFITFWI